MVVHDPLVGFVCVVQLAVLGYHLSLLRVPLEEEVLYYRDGGIIKMKTYCVIMLVGLLLMICTFTMELTAHV